MTCLRINIFRDLVMFRPSAATSATFLDRIFSVLIWFVDGSFPTNQTWTFILFFAVLFNMHDTDGDGKITLEEYRKVSLLLQIHLRFHCVESIMKKKKKKLFLLFKPNKTSFLKERVWERTQQRLKKCILFMYFVFSGWDFKSKIKTECPH